MPTRCRASASLVLSSSFAALFASFAFPQNVQVSGSLALGPSSLGDVLEQRFTPDGSRLLYRAEHSSIGAVDLYSAAADGSSAPVQLSAADPEIPRTSIAEFQVSPDSQWVVFSGEDGFYLSVAPADGSAPAVELDGFHAGFGITLDSTRVVWLGGEELLVAPIDGSGAPDVLSSSEGLSSVRQLGFSPDGTRAVVAAFTCSPPLNCFEALFSVLLDGSQPPVEIDTGVSSFAITPDSSRVVFPRANGAVDVTMHSAPIDGATPPIDLSGTLAFGWVWFEVSSDGSRVVYAPDGGVTEVFSVPVDGSEVPVTLNGPLVSGGEVVGTPPSAAPFQVTPDGARVVYRADQLVNERFELFMTPIAGGDWTKMSGTLVGGGDVHAFQVSPDAIGVLFLSDHDVDNVNELFGAPFTGGVFQLSPNGVAGSNVIDFAITPDNAHVAFRGDLQVNDREELFSVAISGGPATKLNGPLATGGAVLPFRWSISPDSSRVAYIADQETDEVLDVFSAPIATSGASVRLNQHLDGPPEGDVLRFDIAADSSSVVYVAEGDEPGVHELYRGSVDGGVVTKLNGAFVAGGDVSEQIAPSVRITPDGTQALYLADQGTDEQEELYVVPLDGGAAPLKLNQTLLATGQIADFELAPLGERVVYVAHRNGALADLYSTLVSGAGTPVRISAAGQTLVLPTGRTEFRLSPDGTRAVYRAGTNLYSTPVDGSAAPVRLNQTIAAAGGSVGAMTNLFASFLISPDGTRVVYLADARVDERFELYSVSIDGPGASGGGPVRLSAPLPPGGDVLMFAIAAGGERVVYHADQEVDERYELYSVPIRGVRHVRTEDGETLPGRLKLNGTLPPNWDVGGGCCSSTRFVLSPDGSRVLFVLNTQSTSNNDLFSALVDGGTPPVQLTFGQPGVGSVTFSPTGQRIVYTLGGSSHGLYSAFPDGSAPAVRLSDATATFAISPDGAWVAFRDELDAPGLFELYARPIDGSAPRIQLNGTLQPDGDVGGDSGDDVRPPLSFTPDSSHVVYGADQDLDEVFELYATPLP